MSEEEIIKYIELDIKITTEQINNKELFMTEELEKKRIKYLQGLLDLYNKEKKKNKRYEKYLRNKDIEHEKVLEYIETEIETDYIPKSKAREKIEEINDEELNFNENDYWIEQEMKGYAIDHIQELLQEGDDK